MTTRGCRMLAGAIAACSVAPAVQAGGTPAGTTIDNVATATFDAPGGARTVSSNMVSLRVDELLGVVVASGDPGPVSAQNGEAGKALRFQVTNAGNGPEAFILGAESAIGGDDFDPTFVNLVLDTNGNGVYDLGVDTVQVAGAAGPLLAPDQSVTVFLLSTMPDDAADGARGTARLTAAAATGSGAPGTLFAGAGEGGGDAVVGSTTASARADGVYALQSVAVVFTKSATVVDPFGGTRAVPGSIVSYTLRATLSGNGSLANLRVSDTIPTGTTYQPGSLTYAGAAMTDAADADAGRFANNAISVAVPTAAAGSSHDIAFKVRID